MRLYIGDLVCESPCIENLDSCRLDTLEQRLEGESPHSGHGSQSQLSHVEPGGSSQSSAHDVLVLLAKELPKLVQSTSSHSSTAVPAGESPRKRRRSDLQTSEPETGFRSFSPSPDIQDVDAIVCAYFDHVHPWIPMIHQGRFMQAPADGTANTGHTNILRQAMVVAASKFVPDHGSNTQDRDSARKHILGLALQDSSLASLQALIILAFDDLGHGNTRRAWQILGCLTSTAEYMQLSCEQGDNDSQPFCEPYAPLQQPGDFTDAEERRRIFWIAFLLERFCCVTTGWSRGSTSEDVHQRLPCDGHLWRKVLSVTTPYFGTWDKSRSTTELSTIGALAYNIEATDSLSRVASYVLQPRVDLRDPQQVSVWLSRFKELDSRLVHWKLLLPQKWRANPNMTRHVPLMDPNLTTAHLTHNASMILLHQIIAYPLLSWPFRNQLPSMCSADACYSASVEIASIAEKYLLRSPTTSPLSAQCSFCLFIAARILLVRWQTNSQVEQLASEFWSILRSLGEMSKRWSGLARAMDSAVDLSAKYALRLRELHDLCVADPLLSINIMGWTSEINQDSSLTGKPRLSIHDNPRALHAELHTNVPTELWSEDFDTIASLMLDQDFSDMDRVIAFDDGMMFAAELETAGMW